MKMALLMPVLNVAAKVMLLAQTISCVLEVEIRPLQITLEQSCIAFIIWQTLRLPTITTTTKGVRVCGSQRKFISKSPFRLCVAEQIS